MSIFGSRWRNAAGAAAVGLALVLAGCTGMSGANPDPARQSSTRAPALSKAQIGQLHAWSILKPVESKRFRLVGTTNTKQSQIVVVGIDGADLDKLTLAELQKDFAQSERFATSKVTVPVTFAGPFLIWNGLKTLHYTASRAPQRLHYVVLTKDTRLGVDPKAVVQKSGGAVTMPFKAGYTVSVIPLPSASASAAVESCQAAVEVKITKASDDALVKVLSGYYNRAEPLPFDINELAEHENDTGQEVVCNSLGYAMTFARAGHSWQTYRAQITQRFPEREIYVTAQSRANYWLVGQRLYSSLR